MLRDSPKEAKVLFKLPDGPRAAPPSEMSILFSLNVKHAKQFL